MKKYLFLTAALLLVAIQCFAQVASPSPSPSPSPALVPGAALELSLEAFLHNPTVLVVASVVYELLCRFVPTQKASGVLHLAAGLARVVAAGLSVLAAFSDSILPQAVVASSDSQAAPPKA